MTIGNYLMNRNGLSITATCKTSGLCFRFDIMGVSMQGSPPASAKRAVKLFIKFGGK